MLALQKTSGGPGVHLVSIPGPDAPGPGEVIVEVVAAGICGSDLHIEQWEGGYDFLLPALPVTLGHEFSGVLSALGEGVDPSAIGRRVVVKPSVACGKCEYCVRGDEDDCQSRKPIGILQNGAFAKYVRVPFSQCIEIPENLDLELAALVEPLTISEHAVQDGAVKPEDRVVIFGPGTIGQGAAVMARLAGASQIVVVGYDDKPRFDVLRTLGFNDCFDLAEPGAQEALRKLAGKGFNVAIEAAGVNSALELGLELLETCGVLVAVGIHGRKVQFDITPFVRRRLRMVGSYRATHDIWVKCVSALAANPDSFRPMVTHRLPLAEGVEGFRLGFAKQASKVLLFP